MLLSLNIPILGILRLKNRSERKNLIYLRSNPRILYVHCYVDNSIAFRAIV
jgi:hypothetical protein